MQRIQWLAVAAVVLGVTHAAPAKHDQPAELVSPDGGVFLIFSVDRDNFEIPEITRLNGRVRADADEAGSVLQIIRVGSYSGDVALVGESRYAIADLSGVDLSRVPVPLDDFGFPDFESLDNNQITHIGSFRTLDGQAHIVSPNPADIPQSVQKAFFNASAHFDELLAEFPNPTTCQLMIFIHDYQGDAGATIQEISEHVLVTTSRLECTTCTAEFDLPVHEPDGDKLFDAVATLDFDNNLFDTDTILPVPLQVKGVSDTNPFNLGSNGVLPCAILSTEAFDAVAELDPYSLTILGVGIEKYSIVDANDDGLLDLKVHWDTQALVAAGVDENTTMLYVDGSLKGASAQVAGMSCAGADGIRIVPPVD